MDFNFQHENGRWFTAGPDFNFEVDTPYVGGFSFSPFRDAKVTSIAAMPGEYPESMMIPEIRRPHYTEDGVAASFEAISSMPFGIPFKIQREFRLTENILKSDVTFLLPHSFAITNLVAGGLKFSGAIRTVAVTEVPPMPGEIQIGNAVDFNSLDEHAELFKGDVPPLMIVLTFENGKMLTFELGAEIWRWINARNMGGGTASFGLRREKNDLLFTWGLYAFRTSREMPDPPFGRNWSLSWSLVSGTDGIPEQYTNLIDFAKLTRECACSGTAEKLLKKEFRRCLANAQDGDKFVLCVPTQRMCDNSSHMSRPKKSGLIHWELPALRDFTFWANRQMKKRGASLSLAVAEK